MDIQRNSQYSS